MELRKTSSDLTYKILASLQVKDWQKYESDLLAIVATALAQMYIKGRNHERDGIDWQVLNDGSVYIPK